ncbi:MAG: PIN domain-containing protein [Runella sp.]
MKVVLDANILFAALRATNRTFRQQLYFSDYSFYAPKFLIVEIFEHKERIVGKSKASPYEVYEYLDDVLQKINFVSNDFISYENYIRAYHLCKAVDEDDTPFVALALELKAKLWSKDETLKSHLIKNGFDSFYAF